MVRSAPSCKVASSSRIVIHRPPSLSSVYLLRSAKGLSDCIENLSVQCELQGNFGEDHKCERQLELNFSNSRDAQHAPLETNTRPRTRPGRPGNFASKRCQVNAA